MCSKQMQFEDGIPNYKIITQHVITIDERIAEHDSTRSDSNANRSHRKHKKNSRSPQDVWNNRRNNKQHETERNQKEFKEMLRLERDRIRKEQRRQIEIKRKLIDHAKIAVV